MAEGGSRQANFGGETPAAGAILNRFEEESDITIRRTLLLGLGEYSEEDLSPDTRKVLLPKLQNLYRTASDPGLHASAEWLLRAWKQQVWLQQVNDKWAKDQTHCCACDCSWPPQTKRLDRVLQDVDDTSPDVPARKRQAAAKKSDWPATATKSSRSSPSWSAIRAARCAISAYSLCGWRRHPK
jgi:hypothetical protein